MLKLFADETGTHDADVVALAGIIESREYWEHFRHEWQTILRNYNAKYFHYREFRLNANANSDDPYFGWSLEKRKNFLYRLATLVGESAVPCAGGYAIELNRKLGTQKDPFVETITSFYESAIAMLDRHWKNYSGRVHFIFDETNKSEWKGPLYEIHAKYKIKDSRIGGISFGDDKDPEHLPLQAADFSVVHYRNAIRETVQAVELDAQQPIDVRIIDFLTHKNMDGGLRALPKDKFNKLILDMRDHESKTTTLWRQMGIKKTYVPLKEFPFKEYGYQK